LVNDGTAPLNNLVITASSPAPLTTALAGQTSSKNLAIGQTINNAWSSALISSAQFEGTTPNFCVTVGGTYYKDAANPNFPVSDSGCTSFAVEDECSDGILNVGSPVFETDVDCGGDVCNACSDGDTCLDNQDCVVTSACTGGVCTHIPTCTDNILNQDETDVDCGGSICGDCADGKTCNLANDCSSGYCIAGVCGIPDRVVFRTNALSECNLWTPSDNNIRALADIDGDGDLDTYTRAGGGLGGSVQPVITYTPWNNEVYWYNSQLYIKDVSSGTPCGAAQNPVFYPKVFSVTVPMNLAPAVGYDGINGWETYDYNAPNVCGNSVCEADYGQGETYLNCPSDCGVPASPVVFRTNFNPTVPGNYCGTAWTTSTTNPSTVWISVDGDTDGDLDVYSRQTSGSNPSCTGVWPIVANAPVCGGTQVRRDATNTVVVCPGGSSGTGYRFQSMTDTNCVGCTALRPSGEIDLNSIASYASVPGHECYADGTCS